MKKLGLVMSMITISLLASCGGAAPTNKYDLTATCRNGVVSGNKGQYEENEDVILTFIANQGYELPMSKNDITFTGIDGSIVTYLSESGSLTFKMPNGPVSVIVTATDDKWYLDETYISNLDEDNIGTIQNLIVNGINHTVRLIGVDHDDLANSPGKAHTTWEFANLLSDSDGYSLAVPWNWRDGASSTNQNYLDSNLREAFDGNGKGELCWYRKKQTTSEQTRQTEYANKTVFDMLPSSLQNVIKEVKKPIATTSDYDVNTYDAKVFPLSYKEMTEKASSTDAKDEGSTYAFYKGAGDTDANRVKHQVKWHNGAVKASTTIEDGKYNANNYAGYNSSTSNKGGNFWLRSPCISSDNSAWSIHVDGYIGHTYFVYYRAYAVVPAFCI